jgi:hypothetical protein
LISLTPKVLGIPFIEIHWPDWCARRVGEVRVLTENLAADYLLLADTCVGKGPREEAEEVPGRMMFKGCEWDSVESVEGGH